MEKVESSVQSFTIGDKILIIYKANNRFIYHENIFDRTQKTCGIGIVSLYTAS